MGTDKTGFLPGCFLREFGGGGGGETPLKRRRSNDTRLRRVCRRWVFYFKAGKERYFCSITQTISCAGAAGRGWKGAAG